MVGCFNYQIFQIDFIEARFFNQKSVLKRINTLISFDFGVSINNRSYILRIMKLIQLSNRSLVRKVVKINLPFILQKKCTPLEREVHFPTDYQQFMILIFIWQK